METDFNKLKKRILTDKSFDLNEYSQNYVKRRLNARIISLELAKDSWGSYTKILEKDPKEYIRLFDTFSINVTEFFRDVSLWETLQRNVFPRIISEKTKIGTQPSIRVWSAACSSGEEPYSIAIIFKELLPRNISLTITATDIDEDALSKAREGIYQKDSLKNVGQICPGWLEKYFTQVVDPQAMSSLQMTERRKYRISDEIKSMVVFKKHNFLSDVHFGKMDIIFCRNASIYLSGDVKNRLLEKFCDNLVNEGLLVVGKSEIIFQNKGSYSFATLDLKEHIYRKIKPQ